MTTNIAQNIQNIKDLIPDHVELVAVSKTKPISAIQDAYKGGQRIFGENKVNELVEKQKMLPNDIQWHFIGHLQRNKVKYISPFVSLIHGVDTIKLLLEIEKQGKKNKRVIPCLLQFKIAIEETKSGLSTNDIPSIVDLLPSLHYVKIQGVMGMATFTSNQIQIQEEFGTLSTILDQLKSDFPTPYNKELKTCSMGMSGDYPIAIAYGSNMIRVGSAIFGTR